MDNYVIVTGGEGFVGNSLIHRLFQDTEYNIISLDCELTGTSIDKIKSDRVKYIKTDINNESPLSTSRVLSSLVTNKFKNKVDTIFHFGEYSRVVPSLMNIDTVINSNVHLTIDVIKLCMENDIKLIYSASSTKFDSATINKTPYPYFKNFMVETIRKFGEWYKMRYNICYFYNVYGPGQVETGEYKTVIGIWENKFRNKLPIPVVGDGMQSRDFTHIDDIVNGLYLTMTKGINRHEYHLGTGTDHKIKELAELFGTKIVYLPKKGDLEREAGRAPEDNLANSELGWSAKHDIVEYIKSIVAGSEDVRKPLKCDK